MKKLLLLLSICFSAHSTPLILPELESQSMMTEEVSESYIEGRWWTEGKFKDSPSGISVMTNFDLKEPIQVLKNKKDEAKIGQLMLWEKYPDGLETIVFHYGDGYFVGLCKHGSENPFYTICKKEVSGH